MIEQLDGKTQEYQFEKMSDLRTALDHLPALIGDKLDNHIR